MHTIEIRIKASEGMQDILVAELGDLPVVGFQQEDARLLVYVLEENWNPSLRSQVEKILLKCGERSDLEERRIESRNWNRLWEESYPSVRVGSFVVRPSWNDQTESTTDLIDLVIDPKMSFGTGHHETTRLMLLHLLQNQDVLDRVLDMGTGTGILAIAAWKLGAKSVRAFDIDPWCVTNTEENLKLNGAPEIVQVRLGSIDDVDDEDYSMILANINRNVLTEEMPRYIDRLAPDGKLAVSGVLTSDREYILTGLEAAAMIPEQELVEGEWWSVVSRRSVDPGKPGG